MYGSFAAFWVAYAGIEGGGPVVITQFTAPEGIGYKLGSTPLQYLVTGKLHYRVEET